MFRFHLKPRYSPVSAFSNLPRAPCGVARDVDSQGTLDAGSLARREVEVARSVAERLSNKDRSAPAHIRDRSNRRGSLYDRA
jgi:hypothetical protein